MTTTTLSEHRCFDGLQGRYRHASACTGTDMTFSLFLPPVPAGTRVPVLYFLSGLTCTDENFVLKAGAQRDAAEHGVALVAPDTSPRGCDLPGEHERDDFGSGAGFYVDATQDPWARHYRMYEYVNRELPALLAGHPAVDASRASICGHSMGGHGALVSALRNPDRFRSVSAFAPIAAPSQCAWGQRAFTGYLGDDRTTWAQYDATELVLQHGWKGPVIRIDQGERDPFLAEQLRLDCLESAAATTNVALDVRRRAGYDHGYFFVASFIGEHVALHADALGRSA